MALAIATNTGALMAAASASSVNKDMETSMERLSTGKRINSAADDAAGVAIASRLSSEIRGTNQAIRNALDAQGMLSTAEGAHKEIENILQRMRELAVQASSDTNDATDRSNLDAEMQQLVTEIDRIANVTTWAGQSLLNGANTTGFNFQIGGRTSTDDSLNVLINSVSAAALGVSGAGGGTTGSAASSISDSTFAASFANSTLSITAAATGQAAVAAQDAAPAVSEVQAFASVLVENSKAYTIKDSTGTTIATTNSDTDATLAEIASALNTNAGAGYTIALDAAGTGLTITWAAGGPQEAASLEIGTMELDTETGSTNETITLDLTATNGAALNTALNDGMTLSVTTNGQTVELSAASGTTYADAAAVVAALQADADYETAGFTIAADGTNIVVTFNDFGAGASNSATLSHNAETSTEVVAGADAQAAVTAQPAVTNEVITVTLGSNSFDVDLDTSSFATANDQAAAIADALNADATFAGQYGATAIGSTIVFSGLGDAFNVNSRDNALSAITAIDTAISTVNTQRANLGAYSNRLESTVANLTNIVINLEGGKGRIEDADFAVESTSLAKSQILQQASTAMLAQANASKQNVLSLLQG